MRNDSEHLSGWTTSASIGETLWCFFKTKSKDPIYNFRSFAFPALIRAIWILFSWLWVLASGTAIALIFLNAVQINQYDAQRHNSFVESEKLKFVERMKAKSELLLNGMDGAEFLRGLPRNDTKLLELKKTINSDSSIFDVLLFNGKLQSLTGTDSYDLGEQFGNGVQRVKINKTDRTFVKFLPNDSNQKLWIAIIWNETLREHNSTGSSLMNYAIAFGISLIILIFLVPGLLLIRLQCETLILFFRFVDEIAAIHATLKNQQKGELK